MNISPDLHSYVLFASAAKHAMDDALRFRRSAKATADEWLAGFYVGRAESLRCAAWSHIAAAKKAKRLAG